MSFYLEKAIWSNIFAVPCDVVDKHLKLCSETALRVLLLLLRNGGSVPQQELARLTGRPEDEVRDALSYWAGAGILVLPEYAEPEPIAAEPVTAAAIPEPAGAPAPSAAESVPAMPEARPVLEYVAVSGDGPQQRKIRTLSHARARLGPREINQMARTDENIAYLLQEAQAVLGKPLTPIATDTIASLYSYYGMQPDLILMLLQYCVTIGKDNMRYVEKVAASWLEDGVDTHEKAEQRILRATELSTMEHKVMRAFGIYDRKLVPSEQKYLAVWINEYHFDLDMITLAFERAVEQKGKLSFPYIGGILSDWSRKNIRTPAEALRDMQQKSSQQAAPAAAAAKAGKSSYDLEELEQMITYRGVE